MKKVLFFTSDIDLVLSGSSKVAGIPLQMSIWAKTFKTHGWSTYCLTTARRIPYVMEDIHFVPYIVSNLWIKMHLSLVAEFFMTYKLINELNPNLIIARGSGRYLYSLSLIAKLKNIKLVFFSASDINFTINKSMICGSRLYTSLYQSAIKNIRYFVTQNSFQAEMLQRNYSKTSLCLFNIWPVLDSEPANRIYDCIWVSNLRPLKRAEWFLELAHRNPSLKFVMCGGPLDEAYYEDILSKSRDITNLEFMGALPVSQVESLISKSRVLICTSEYEGFPNTFIQAWSYLVPVVSTVNPSSVISDNGLGCVVGTGDELHDMVNALLSDSLMMQQVVTNISEYFPKNHWAEDAYNKLLGYIG